MSAGGHDIDGAKCGDLGGDDPRNMDLDELAASALEHVPGRFRSLGQFQRSVHGPGHDGR